MGKDFLIASVLIVHCILSSCFNRTSSATKNNDDSLKVCKENISTSIIDESEYIDKQWDTTGMRFLTDNIDDDYRPETVADTAINKFRIRYKVLYNDQLVPCYDTLLPNRSVFLNVQYNKNLLLNREFRVTDFSDIIPVAECGKYQLSGMIQPESISDSTVSFRLGYYIPDTDLGYPIMLTVTKEGKVLTSLIDEGELGED